MYSVSLHSFKNGMANLAVKFPSIQSKRENVLSCKSHNVLKKKTKQLFPKRPIVDIVKGSFTLNFIPTIDYCVSCDCFLQCTLWPQVLLSEGNSVVLSKVNQGHVIVWLGYY